MELDPVEDDEAEEELALLHGPLLESLDCRWPGSAPGCGCPEFGALYVQIGRSGPGGDCSSAGRASNSVFNDEATSSSISSSAASITGSFCTCSWSSEREVRTKLEWHDVPEEPPSFESWRPSCFVGELLAELLAVRRCAAPGLGLVGTELCC